MDIGIAIFPAHDAISPAAVARLAEERGYESLFFPEHTHIPASRATPYAGGGELPFPVLRPPERAVARLAASGRFRAVIAGLSGRVALPAAYAGARAGRVPFVLWATIWRQASSSGLLTAPMSPAQ